MAKRLLKAMILPLTVMATALAFIACDGSNTPDVKFKVTYSIGTDATGTAPTETDKAFGEKFKLKSVDGIQPPTGKKFDGWNDGSLTYQAGDTYTMPSKAVTFTAQWGDGEEPTKYTVTYDLDGGTGTLPTETDKAAGEKFNLAAATGLSKGTKELTGWNDGDKTYNPGAEYTMPDKAITLTAQWGNGEQPAAKYNVTYKHGEAKGDNGAAVANITAQNQAAGNYTVGAPSLYFYDDEEEEASYLFSGWVNEKNKNDDNPTVYLPGQTLTLAENTTFEAVWVEVGEIALCAIDTTSIVTLYAYPNGIGAYWYDNAQGTKEIWTFFTYTLEGSTVKATPVGGTEVTGTLNEKGELTMEIKIGMLTYYFEPEQELPTGAPTFTFQLNGGTGTVPTLTVTEDMKKGSYYMVPMPANTITPPAGKEFRRWTISDGTGTWSTNAGSKFSADEGVAYTVKPEWKDAAVTPVVPSGTKYTGDWNTPAGQGGLTAVPSVNITEVWLNKQTNKLYYVVGGTAKEAAVTANSDELTAEMKTAYGNDAALYSVTIETLAYNIVVQADNSKLAFAGTNADMTLYTGGEFTAAAAATYTVTYNKPDDAEGAMADVTANEGSYTLAACTYTKTGWTFLGWLDESLTSRDDPVVAAAGDTVTLSKNMSYIAVFAKTYTNADDSTVTLDLRDDGYVLIDLYGDVYAEWTLFAENTVVITVGWSYTAFIYLNGNTYTECDEMVAYSFTTKDGNTTLTFDGNGKATLGTHEGTYTIISDDYYGYTIGVNLTFDGKSYACEFDGDDDGVVYICATITAGGTEYVFDPYTAWYTITFEVDNDVTGAPESPVRIHNSIGGDNQAKVEFPDEYYMSKSGHYFVGWAVKDSDGTVGNTVSTYNYKVTADTTFVAVWVKSTFTVTYLPGDVGSDAVTGFEETGSASVNRYTFKGTIAKLRSDVTRAGYILSHWVIQGDDSGNTYTPGQSNVLVDGDTTFVAVWVAATPHTVTYNLGGGTGTLPTETDKLMGAKFNLAASTGLTNGDKEFDGWSDGTKKYAAGAEYTMPDADVTFTAQWKDTSTGALTGTKTYIGTYNNKPASIVINFDTNEVIFNYIVSGEETTYTYSNLTKSDDGYFIQSSNNPTGSAVWVVVSADGTTVKLYDDWNGPDEQQGGDYTLQQGGQSYKIAHFIGTGSSNPVTYGYDSASDSSGNTITISGVEYYGIKIYYGVGDEGKATLSVLGSSNKAGYVRSYGTTTTLTKKDDISVDETVFTLYASGFTNITISFKVEDGKRKVTISDGTTSVTWEEIA